MKAILWKRIGGWLGRGLLALLGLVGLFLLSVSAVDRIVEARTRLNRPPGSLLVDVGGRKIHLYPGGTGNPGPAVVLVPGQPGDASPDSGWWAAVQPELAKTLRVYAYDEPGYGWSDLHPEKFSARHSAEDLRKALLSLGEKEIVLVSFANGNLTALDFYAQGADEPRILGMVWIDPDELTRERIALIRQDYQGLSGLIRAAGAATDLGLGRILVYDRLVVPADQQGLALLPAGGRESFDWDLYRCIDGTRGNRSALHATLDRASVYAEDLEYSASLALPTRIPLDILQTDLASEIENLTPAAYAQIPQKTAWYRQVVAGSSAGRYIHVPGSSHLIMIERPAEVIRAVQDLVQRVAP
jgi:pimeloyl-ACP methyl ester carboxylesterase